MPRWRDDGEKEKRRCIAVLLVGRKVVDRLSLPSHDTPDVEP
jgi:hypothetical protein